MPRTRRYQAYENTPVEIELKRRAARCLWCLAVILLIILLLLAFRYAPNRPVTYANIVDHFKYGSIGSDMENGLPLRIMKVLPRMFSEYLPPGSPQDYTAFGFIQEKGKEMPIGFSIRRRIIDLVGLNCAACHVGLVRASIQSEPKVYLGMPADTVDLLAFFDFLFQCAADSRFTPEKILPEIEKDGYLLPTDRYIYTIAITEMRAGLLARKAQLDVFLTPGHPRFGPGRVDTFNPYKVNQFAQWYRQGIPQIEQVGTADFPSIWNQKVREGMHLHWDGNNTSLRERNFSAAFGAGATRENVDEQAIDRVQKWVETLPPPAYPFARTNDPKLLARGKAIYDRYCFACHDIHGQYVGQVLPLAEIRTDEHRLNSYTQKLRDLQLAYGQGYDWQFKHFIKTNGYANVPLDGIWARAPYLHNGSVPTLQDLLTPAERRADRLLYQEGKTGGARSIFYVGHGVYDPKNVGFRIDVKEVDGRRSFAYDITQTGNSNKGHTGQRYGTELSDSDKWALIEYLKTL
ncbi:MAG TPA: cytochrome c [Chthonomonadaceae bacterium]|nr:cytochrome c [Chthonomonadaceae bacterium]